MLQNFFFGPKVYAQNTIVKPEPVADDPIELMRSLDNNTDVNELKSVDSTILTPKGTLPSESNTTTKAGRIIACKQQGNTWNTNNVNVDGACFATCPNGYVQDNGLDVNECIIGNAEDLGIQCSAERLRNGTCTWNINKTLGIRSSETSPNPTLLVQDIILSATSFIGTMMVIALIVMGVKYIKGGFDEGSDGDLKNNIKKLLIGLFLVIGSYTIIRLIQYVARGY